jgi:hypothetical protein
VDADVYNATQQLLQLYDSWRHLTQLVILGRRWLICHWWQGLHCIAAQTCCVSINLKFLQAAELLQCSTQLCNAAGHCAPD